MQAVSDKGVKAADKVADESAVDHVAAGEGYIAAGKERREVVDDCHAAKLFYHLLNGGYVHVAQTMKVGFEAGAGDAEGKA